MKKLLIVLFLICFVLFGCGPNDQMKNSTDQNDEKTAVSGIIIIEGSQTLFPLMNKWKQEFEKTQPEIKISVKSNNTDIGLKKISNNIIQLAMVSRNLNNEETKSGFWSVPVAKDAVLPVISFDNNNLQKIVLAGVTKEKLAAAFTGKIKTWGQLLQLKSNDPIEVYKLNDSTGTTHIWKEFLNINTQKIIGTQVYSNTDIPIMIASNKNAIGYCSTTNIFDIKTGLIKRNLYVLPVDLNANNQADDNELVFDKLDDIKSAISSGKYPSPPVRKLYLVSKTIPSDVATVSFIKWILTIGQSYCAQYGFVNITKNEASEYLKLLK